MDALLHDPLFVGAPLVTFVRWLLVLVAGYNVVWTLPGIYLLFRGRNWPISVFRAGVCLLSVGSVGLNLNVVVGGESGVDSMLGLGFFILLLGGHLCIAFCRVAGVERKVAKFFEFYPNIDNIVALEELYAMDPEKAKKHEKAIRADIVEVLMRRSEMAGWSHDDE